MFCPQAKRWWWMSSTLFGHCVWTSITNDQSYVFEKNISHALVHSQSVSNIKCKLKYTRTENMGISGYMTAHFIGTWLADALTLTSTFVPHTYYLNKYHYFFTKKCFSLTSNSLI